MNWRLHKRDFYATFGWGPTCCADTKIQFIETLLSSWQNLSWSDGLFPIRLPCLSCPNCSFRRQWLGFHLPVFVLFFSTNFEGLHLKTMTESVELISWKLHSWWISCFSWHAATCLLETTTKESKFNCLIHETNLMLPLTLTIMSWM